MAMNGAVLGAAIKSAMDTLSEADKKDIDKAMEALGNSIVDHITNNAVIAVTSVSGVTTGGSSSGPGTGTIS